METIWNPRQTSRNLSAPTKAAEVVGAGFYPGWVSVPGPEVKAALRSKAFYVASVASPSNASVDLQVVAGDTIIVGYYLNGALAACTCVDSAGNEYVEVGDGVWAAGGAGLHVHVFYAKAATTGRIRITCNGTGTYPGVAAHAVEGLEDSLGSVLDRSSEIGEQVSVTYHSTLVITPTTPDSYLFSFWGEVSGERPYTIPPASGFRLQNYAPGVGVDDKFVSSQGVSVGYGITTALNCYYANIFCAFKVKQSTSGTILHAPQSTVYVSSAATKLALRLVAQASIIAVVSVAPILHKTVSVPASNVTVSAYPASIVTRLHVQQSVAHVSSAPPRLSASLRAPQSIASVVSAAPKLRKSCIVPSSTVSIASQAPKVRRSLLVGSSVVAVTSTPPVLVISASSSLAVPASNIVVGSTAPKLGIRLHAASSTASIASTAPKLAKHLRVAASGINTNSTQPKLSLHLRALPSNSVVSSVSPALRYALHAQPSTVFVTAYAPSLAASLSVSVPPSTVIVSSIAPSLRSTTFVVVYNSANEVSMVGLCRSVEASYDREVCASDQCRETSYPFIIRDVSSKRKTRTV